MREFFRNFSVKLQRWKPLFYLFLPISLFLVELFGFFFLAYERSSFDPAQLWPLAFAGLWALLLSGLLWLLPRTAARISYGVIYFLTVIYAGFQTGYYLMFDQMMWLSDFRYASEGADYADVLLSYPAGWWLGLLGLIVFGALLLWKFPRWQRSPQGAVAAVLVVALAIGGAIALPEWVFYCDYQALQDGSEADRLAAGDYGRMQSAEAAYENLFNAHRLYQVCGLNQMLCKDLYTHVIYPMTPSYLVAQKEAKGQIGQ